MAVYRPGRGFDEKALERLRARRQESAGFADLPAEDRSKQWDALLGTDAKKIPRCSVCTKPADGDSFFCSSCRVSPVEKTGCIRQRNFSHGDVGTSSSSSRAPSTDVTSRSDASSDTDAPASILYDIAPPGLEELPLEPPPGLGFSTSVEENLKPPPGLEHIAQTSSVDHRKILESDTPSILDNMELPASENHTLEDATALLQQQVVLANNYAQMLAHQSMWLHWQVQWSQAVQAQHQQMMLGASMALGNAETSGRKRCGTACSLKLHEGCDEVEKNTKFTTVMMRNIPYKYSREQLLNLFDEQGFATYYDLVYLPLDFETGLGLGYAFINFVSNETAERFQAHFNGFSKWRMPSSKVCEVSWSDARAARRLKANSAYCGIGSRTGRGVE